MVRRIAFASEEPVVLTFDGHVLLAFDATTLAARWRVELEHPIAAVVFASLPRVHAGNPWRSPSSGSDALVVDQRGGLHAVDVLAGRVLGSRAPVGKPVAVAAAGGSFALALLDCVHVWHAGVRHELDFRATALSLSGDVLALGTAKGQVHEVGLTTRAATLLGGVNGAVTAIAPRRAGEWIVATASAVHHVTSSGVRRLRESGAQRIACDVNGRVLALQSTVDRVLVCDWPAAPVTRIEMMGRTISDLALSGDRLALAVQGGDVNLVPLASRRHLASEEHPGRHSRPWALRVESEREAAARSERGANRYGVGAALTLIMLLLCMAYLSSSSKQNWVPPPAFLVTETCDTGCEMDRVAHLAELCAEAPGIDCAADADEAEAAYEMHACDETRAALGRVRDRLGARDDGLHAQLSAALASADRGLTTSCAASSSDANLLAIARLAGAELAPERESTSMIGSDPRALWAGEDETLLLATVSDGHCAFRRKLPGQAWRTLRRHPSCSSAALWAKSAHDAYVALGRDVHHFDGATLRDLSFPGSDVQAVAGTREVVAVLDAKGALYTYRNGAWKKESASLNESDLWRWVKGNGEVAKGTAVRGDVWLAPDGTLFGANGSSAEITRGSPRGEIETTTTALSSVVERVWGRTSRDVYAGGPQGLVHYDGAGWSETPFRGRVRALAGSSRAVWVISDKP